MRTALALSYALITILTSKVTAESSFWLEDIKHQGVAAFSSNSSYQVFRNVKDFGAKGDGVSDDTAAINLAISSGGRCGPGLCQSSTQSSALVYFPSGIYQISKPIIDYYYTQLIGNPNEIPIIKAASNFTAFALIDGDQYQPGNAANPAGSLGFNSTNVFYRQIRNLELDTTSALSNLSINCIHWPTAQATSLQNVVFRMSDAPGTQHQGLFIEAGSGGFMSDLTFYGGLTGAFFGNQQFTSRNLTFYGAVVAIDQIFDWGWTYSSINISNCSVGLNMTNAGPSMQAVGSITFIDSYIENTPVGIVTSYGLDPSSASNGSLILENVSLQNVGVAVSGSGNVTALAGSSGSKKIAAWGQGHEYAPEGPASFQGVIPTFSRPGGLVANDGKYYQRSKPTYATTPASQFLSVRTYGAKGDGKTDDTAALQKAIDQADVDRKILFIDAGTYRVTKTITLPVNAKIVGESYPVIMSSGQFFMDMSSPQPVICVGEPGDVGAVEWSDMIISTQGAQSGAILIEWNLASSGAPSGMWDVHTRVGGFTGSQLQLADCAPISTSSNPGAPIGEYTNSTSSSSSSTGSSPAKTMNSTSANSNSTGATINPSCIAAYMSMYITKSASGLYMENVWLWTADHDLDSNQPNTNITVYAGRGLYIESQEGNIMLVGTAVEHHSLYQYQLANTQNIFMGQIQTETAYYQPSPDITSPFSPEPSLNDPNAAELCMGNGTCTCRGNDGNCDAWGLRIIDSQNINVYGAGLYSFYNDYSTTCSQPGNGEACQASIFSIEGAKTQNVNVYNLNTIGATSMIDRDGTSLANYADNVDVFPDTIAVFRSG